MKSLTLNVGKISDVKTSTFPAGEPFVKVENDKLAPDIEPGTALNIRINAYISTPTEIFELLLTKNALDKLYPNSTFTLNIPYIPFGRQDRYMSVGEPFSLKVFAKLINDLKFNKVITYTPHSDVSNALIENLEIKEDYTELQKFLSFNFPHPWTGLCFVAPDAGAMKRAANAAKAMNIDKVICATKFRNPLNGEITGIHIPKLDKPHHYIVIDDICDGGATFIELAKHIENRLSLNLYVTHGIYSKGKDVIFDAGYDRIFQQFDFLEKKTNV